MIPIIDDFKQRFDLKDFVVVADSGLMSKTNVKLLKEANYKYIIGARLRNESETVKDWVPKHWRVSADRLLPISSVSL